MDALDRQIVAVLQAEGRITLTELADRVRLSVSRCQRRVRELEADATIRGYSAVIDAAALGYGFEVLLFATLTRPGAVPEFESALAGIPRSSRPSGSSANRITSSAWSAPTCRPTSISTTTC